MNLQLFTITFAAFAMTGIAADQPMTGFPFQNEALHYTLNYSSGLSVGDATLSAHKTGSGWDFTISLDASLAGFHLKDQFNSSMNTSYCSTELKRDILHGSKASREKTTFDLEKQVAHRVTEFPNNGGSSDLNTGACGRDAVDFIYFARKELGQGRVVPPQYVYFGSAYLVTGKYTGEQTVTLSDKKPEKTDRMVFTVKGPQSQFTVEVNYARDAARTPLLIKIPQAAGTLSMELVR